MQRCAARLIDSHIQGRERRRAGAPAGRRGPAPAPLSAEPEGLRRGAVCACGGGCPRCEATSSRAAATPGVPFEATPQAGQDQTGDVPVDEAPPVLAPTPAATTYPGCTAAQNRLVETARTTAHSKANAAASAMNALKGGTGTKAQQSALAAHFGRLTATQLDTAKNRYTTISGRLANPALFACGSAPAQAYCGPPENWCAGTVCPTTTGISYLCPNAFGANCAEPNLWSIMLHESGRAAGCCPPDVMPSAKGYPPAAPACLTNVYSYSGFARAV